MALQHPMNDPMQDVLRPAEALQADPEHARTEITALQTQPSQLLFWRAFYVLVGSALGLALGAVFSVLAQELRAWDLTTVLAVSSLPGLLLAGAGWVYAGLRFAHYRGELHRGEGVLLLDGVWWRSETWLPMARLQHLDVHQGPLDRHWAMATLTLHTAGTHDHQLRLRGLPLAQAHALRSALMPRATLTHD